MEKPCATSRSNCHQKPSWTSVLILAYQSLGVVYGDLTTSPLYVYKNTFFASDARSDVQLSEFDPDILGVFSIVFWTLTLVPAVKYVWIVLRADDNGEGGTFALYSLLSRHVKLNLLPSQQAVDEELSTYKLEKSASSHCSQALKSFLEKHESMRIVFLVVVLFGTCMVIGDGVLTPPITVLSAVSGLKVKWVDLHEHYVVLLACLILVGLFALQHYGTHSVGFLFAPIIIAWLFCISAIGIYNIFKWNPSIYKALSPYYMYRFFKKTREDGWISLGGIVLCMTGAEAMFADLGHFSQFSIKIAFNCVVYPCLILAYMGQAAFLSRHPDDVRGNFYMAIPEPVFWPVFVVATLAAVVSSQAVISATFSIIKQSQSLGCFPRVKILHTSNQICGQIYIPEINWILMLVCLSITIGFQDTIMIGNAYGLAAVTVMLVTTCLMFLVMVVVWHKHVLIAIIFLLFFGSIECLYMSACLTKVHMGAWVPLVLSIIFMAIMYTWHYGLCKEYEFEVQNKVSMKWLLTLGPRLGIARVPGIGLIYTNLATGVPVVFTHFVTNFPAFHKVLVFVCVRHVPVSRVPMEERCLIGRIGPREFCMFRCIVRYGYKEVNEDEADFENQLILKIGEFIETEGTNQWVAVRTEDVTDGRMAVIGVPTHCSIQILPPSVHNSPCTSPSIPDKSPIIHGFDGIEEPKSPRSRLKVGFQIPESTGMDRSVRDELTEIIEAKEAGVTYILGHSYVQAKKSSSFLKKFAINVGYNLLKNNCRAPTMALCIPYLCLIQVGMMYLI